MRCDGRAGLPCRRCRRSGAECVFDEPAPRARNSQTRGLQSRQQLHDLNGEVATLKEQVAVLKSGQMEQRIPSLRIPNSHEADLEGDANPSPSTSPTYRADEAVSCHDLSPDNLAIPVSAVHVMMHPPREHEPERSSEGWTVENQSRWNQQDRAKSTRADVIARNLIGEAHARQLFDRYMHGGNSFLPLFDPITDTFDSIRDRSKFIFTVVLYLAARQKHTDDTDNQVSRICEREVRWLAADSLFENPTSLETAEAMTLLSVHSEKTWFALGHAVQLAWDLGLDRVTRRLMADSTSQSYQPSSSKKIRYDLRCARCWLLLIHYDRALAFSTARTPRTGNFDVNDWGQFLGIRLWRPSDVCFCAAIDLLKVASHLRTDAGLRELTQVESAFDSWWRRWDSCYEEHGVEAESFLRVHLKVQKLYATMAHSGTMFVQTMKSQSAPQARGSGTPGRLIDVSRQILSIIQDLFTFIENYGAYKRLFRWAPTYEGLLLTYAVVFGFKLLAMFPDANQQSMLVAKLEKAADMLKEHPCRGVYQLVRRLLHRLQSSLPELTPDPSTEELDFANIENDAFNLEQIFLGESWPFDASSEGFFDLPTDTNIT